MEVETEKEFPGKTKSFTYRADGKIASFQSEGVSVNYFYDALDRRVAKAVNQNGNQYTQSFTHLDQEDRALLGKAGDNSITTYIDGQRVDEHLGEVKNGLAKAYITDHLGSVLNGEPAGSSRQFGLFGEGVKAKISLSSNPVMYGFTGREYDAESGLNYYRARNYDPGTGRFLSQDPIGLDGGDENFYRYVLGNPLIYTDPFGENPFVLGVIRRVIQGTLGATVGSYCSGKFLGSELNAGEDEKIRAAVDKARFEKLLSDLERRQFTKLPRLSNTPSAYIDLDPNAGMPQLRRN